MLKVIEQHEHFFVAQVIEELDIRVFRRLKTQPNNRSYARGEWLRGSYRSQRYPIDAITESAPLLTRRLQGQPCLARAARTHDSSKPVVKAVQPLKNKGQL